MIRAFSAGSQTSVFLGRCPRLVVKPRRWRFDAARSKLRARNFSPLTDLSAVALWAKEDQLLSGRVSELLQKRFPA